MAPRHPTVWRSWPMVGMLILLAVGSFVAAALAGSGVKQGGFMAVGWGFLATSSVWQALSASWDGGTRRAGLWWMAGALGSLSAGQGLQALQRVGKASSWADPFITGLSGSAVICILCSLYWWSTRDRRNQ